MNLIEMNKALMSKRRKEVEIKYQINQDDIILFNDMLNISKNILGAFNITDDAVSFFKLYPDFKKVLPNGKATECFYAMKKGDIWNGIPMKLVYVLHKCFSENERGLVNTALNTAVPLIAPFCEDTYIVGESSFTAKDVICNIVGSNVKLLTTANPIVKYRDCVEVFVHNVNRVAILPLDIAEYVTPDNCETVQWDKVNGVTVEGIPLRTMNKRLGITRHDFDLRQCI